MMCSVTYVSDWWITPWEYVFNFPSFVLSSLLLIVSRRDQVSLVDSTLKYANRDILSLLSILIPLHVVLKFWIKNNLAVESNGLKVLIFI